MHIRSIVSVVVSVQTRKLLSVSYPYPWELHISAKYLSADTYLRISASHPRVTHKKLPVMTADDDGISTLTTMWSNVNVDKRPALIDSNQIGGDAGLFILHIKTGNSRLPTVV